MQHSDSSHPEDWLKIAEKDLKRLQRALRAHDLDQAGFYLQQAVEKFLKAFLLSCGATIRRIHILNVLLTNAISYEPTFAQYRLTCQKIYGVLYAGSLPLHDGRGNYGANRSRMLPRCAGADKADSRGTTTHRLMRLRPYPAMRYAGH